MTSVRTVGSYRSFGGKTQRSTTQNGIPRGTALADWSKLSWFLRTMHERAVQQHHHGLFWLAGQAPCSVILAESVLFLIDKLVLTEFHSGLPALHGQPASSQPARLLN